jgi:hypothetical protein
MFHGLRMADLVTKQTAALTVPDVEDAKEMVVVARNPGEMQEAQQQLIKWASNKFIAAKRELAEAEENLAQAVKSKWRQSGFKRHVSMAAERVLYYEKIHAALSAGYVIVPNFDLDIFAMRTRRSRPKKDVTTSRWNRPHESVFENAVERNALGTGENVDPWPAVERDTITVNDKDGNKQKLQRAWPVAWQDVDFPFKLAKPQILADTSKALALKVFDQVGVTPHRNIRKQDPMVIGQIVFGPPRNQKTVSFLVAWWLESSDLEV